MARHFVSLFLLATVFATAIGTAATATSETNYKFETNGNSVSVVQDLKMNAATTTERTYVFGINLALNATSEEAMQYLDDQISSKIGLEIWRDWWNALPVEERTTKSGEVIRVELHFTYFSNYEYGDWQVQALFDTYDQMIQNPNIDYLFGTIDYAGYDLRNYTYYASGLKVMVAPGDSSENYHSIPGSFGSPTANKLVLASYLPYLRVSQAKTIAILSIYDGIYQNQMCEGVFEQAPLNGLDIVYLNEDMPFTWWTLGKIDNPESVEAWTRALDDIHAINPDALVICDYNFGAEFALKYMKRMNWIPKSIAVSPITRQFDDMSVFDFVIVPTSYNANAKYPMQRFFTDSAGLDQLVRQRSGKPANELVAQALLAGMIYTSALVNAESNSTQDVIAALQLTNLVTFMGTSVFDARRRQTMPSLVTQRLNSGERTNIIGPPQAAVHNIIYPMPTWNERIFKQKWGSGSEIAATVLTILGVFHAIGWLVFLFVHWRHEVIHAASPVFLLTIIIGGMIVNLSIFTWMPNLVNNSTCAMRVWLLPLGFFLLFGALLAKTWRIVRLYFEQSVKIIQIGNLNVAIVILVIVVGQAVLSILSITISKLKSQITVVDEHRVSKNYWTCTYPTSLRIISYINIAYGGCLLLWGIYLAWKVRKVPLARYDESKIIGFSIYNTGIFAAIVIGLQLGIENQNAKFMATAICCFLGPIITVSLLMTTKLRSIHWPSTYSSRSSTNLANRYNTHTHPMNHYSSNTGSMSSDNNNTHKQSQASPRSTKHASQPSTDASGDSKLIKKYVRKIEKLKRIIEEKDGIIKTQHDLIQKQKVLSDDDKDDPSQGGKDDGFDEEVV